MSTLYTQDASPTNPFGIGFYEQAVATSQRLIREREALEAQLLPQINDGPFAFSAVRAARNEFRALEANPAADPAALAAAKAKFEELDSGRARLTAQQEQNARLLEQTRDGLVTNQARLDEARAKAASQPADRPIVNAGADPAANSAPPVVSPDNITGTEPPLDVTTPAANSPAPVTGGDTGEVPGVTTQPSVTSAEPVTGGDTGEVPGVTTQPSVTSPEPVTGGDTGEVPGVTTQPSVTSPEPVPGSTDPGLADPQQRAQEAAGTPVVTPEQQAANEQAAAKANTINQATLNSVYKKEGSADWRVRLQLAPTSDYLYNANPPGILAPLAATNGVIFPYTPQINTAYKANYELYDLVHSNYRGVYYKNSRVDDLSIRGTFTAQDTSEADYLLAVIHFFRSVTKMFYGKDQQRGSPPPLVYLSGLGMNQFYGHPCVVSSFTYNLPDQVDYIRATNYNNYGTDLLSRRTPSQSSGLAGVSASNNRILNAGLERFFPGSKPTPDAVVASVNNTQLANYVPTKMDIDITLIPVQTRSQVSKQFSLKGFANGDLIKGGFW
jgi:hypothetical protein